MLAHGGPGLRGERLCGCTMNGLPPDVTWRDVTGERYVLAADIHLEGRRYRPSAVALTHDGLMASFRQASENMEIIAARVLNESLWP